MPVPRFQSAHDDADAPVLGSHEVLGRNAAILKYQFGRLASPISHLDQLLRDLETRRGRLDDKS